MKAVMSMSQPYEGGRDVIVVENSNLLGLDRQYQQLAAEEQGNMRHFDEETDDFRDLGGELGRVLVDDHADVARDWLDLAELAKHNLQAPAQPAVELLQKSDAASRLHRQSDSPVSEDGGLKWIPNLRLVTRRWSLTGSFLSLIGRTWSPSNEGAFPADSVLIFGRLQRSELSTRPLCNLIIEYYQKNMIAWSFKHLGFDYAAELAPVTAARSLTRATASDNVSGVVQILAPDCTISANMF
jgi:hypothetical protein